MARKCEVWILPWATRASRECEVAPQGLLLEAAELPALSLPQAPDQPFPRGLPDLDLEAVVRGRFAAFRRSGTRPGPLLADPPQLGPVHARRAVLPGPREVVQDEPPRREGLFETPRSGPGGSTLCPFPLRLRPLLPRHRSLSCPGGCSIPASARGGSHPMNYPLHPPWPVKFPLHPSDSPCGIAGVARNPVPRESLRRHFPILGCRGQPGAAGSPLHGMNPSRGLRRA